MNRRDFFKVCSVAAVAAAAPSIVFAKPDAAIPLATTVGEIERMVARDEMGDYWFIRYTLGNAMLSGTQFDYVERKLTEPNEDDLRASHARAETNFAKAMRPA